MNLTPDQSKWLAWLKERGGRGFLDRWGRVVAAGETSPQGATVAWLNLVAKGQICGRNGVLHVNEMLYPIEASSKPSAKTDQFGRTPEMIRFQNDLDNGDEE